MKKGGHIQSERIPSKLDGINDLLQDLIKAAEKKEMQQTFRDHNDQGHYVSTELKKEGNEIS